MSSNTDSAAIVIPILIDGTRRLHNNEAVYPVLFPMSPRELDEMHPNPKSVAIVDEVKDDNKLCHDQGRLLINDGKLDSLVEAKMQPLVDEAVAKFKQENKELKDKISEQDEKIARQDALLVNLTAIHEGGRTEIIKEQTKQVDDIFSQCRDLIEKQGKVIKKQEHCIAKQSKMMDDLIKELEVLQGGYRGLATLTRNLSKNIAQNHKEMAEIKTTNAKLNNAMVTLVGKVDSHDKKLDKFEKTFGEMTTTTRGDENSRPMQNRNVG